MQLFYVKRKAPNFLRAFLLMQQSNPNEYLHLYDNRSVNPVQLIYYDQYLSWAGILGFIIRNTVNILL